MTELQWRRMTEADVEAMAVLEEQVFGREKWTSGQIREELNSPFSAYYGLFTEPGVLGACGGVRVIDDAEVMTMGVATSLRGQGIGRKLLAQLLEHAVSQKAGSVYLEVRASNEPAVGLYESVGFTQLKRIRNYYRFPTEDALLMGMAL